MLRVSSRHIMSRQMRPSLYQTNRHTPLPTLVVISRIETGYQEYSKYGAQYHVLCCQGRSEQVLLPVNNLKTIPEGEHQWKG